MKLNIVFAGTPLFALPCLEALAASKHHVKAVYTQPDRPAGRGRKLQASPIKTWALTHNVPVYQPVNFKSEESIAALAALAPDVMVVIAYGLILPPAVLALPRLGCINVHASLLPRWRGASPIQQAVLHGDAETGVTIMQMDKGLDTGDMLACVRCPIHHETAGQLHDNLAQLAISPLLTTLDALASGQAHPIVQDHQQANYAPKITKEEACIDWHQPADEIDRLIRAFNPWPIAYTKAGDIAIRIHQAHVVSKHHHAHPGTVLAIDKQGILVAAGRDALLIERLQFPGAKALAVTDWLHANNQHLTVNTRFSS